MLIKRRDRIASIYLTAINPMVDPQLDADGRLTFVNAAVAARAAPPAGAYRAAWLALRQRHRPDAGRSRKPRPHASDRSPGGLPTATGSFIEVDLSADSATYPTWRQPIKTYFRRSADGWKLVGLERLPETLAAAPAPSATTSKKN